MVNDRFVGSHLSDTNQSMAFGSVWFNLASAALEKWQRRGERQGKREECWIYHFASKRRSWKTGKWKMIGEIDSFNVYY
jgi:hypothetical protein